MLFIVITVIMSLVQYVNAIEGAPTALEGAPTAASTEEVTYGECILDSENRYTSTMTVDTLEHGSQIMGSQRVGTDKEGHLQIEFIQNEQVRNTMVFKITNTSKSFLNEVFSSSFWVQLSQTAKFAPEDVSSKICFEETSVKKCLCSVIGCETICSFPDE